MKKIEAIVRHHKLEEVKDALSAAGCTGMTITEGWSPDAQTQLATGDIVRIDPARRTIRIVLLSGRMRAARWAKLRRQLLLER